MAENVSVLVVGAGPTGLLLAAELNRRGVNTRIIDSHSAPLHWDRATVVHPRSLEVFESLGILEPLLAQGVKQRSVRIHSAGSVLGEMDLATCGSRYGFNIGVSEEVTEAILGDYLAQQGGVVSRLSTLVDWRIGGDGVLATIQRDGREEQVAAQWVVGCDGFHSAVRELAGIGMIGHDITEPWAVFDVTLAGWPESYEATYAYLEEIPTILTALPQRRWRVYVRPDAPDSDLVADAASTIRRYHPAVAFEDVTNPTRFHCHGKVAARFRSGRIFLAGDAAHVCSPAQGHGMNSGLQDAFNLAWKLALVCHGHSSPALLDTYEAERRPVAERIVASGDAAEELQGDRTAKTRSTRDEMLRKAFADPDTRHHETVAEAELDIDYGGSPIVIGNPHDTLGPGQLLPDTIEMAEGESRLLHEMTFRAGHTALVIGGSSGTRAQLRELDKQIRNLRDVSVIEEMLVLTTGTANGTSQQRISQAAADLLGIRDITLLVVRPDGYLGLRADYNHLEAFTTYQARLKD